MLAYARNYNSAGNISYQQMAFEDLGSLKEEFDLITSSLVFDYAENFEELMKNVSRLMKQDSLFVFSMSHPMSTAYDGKYPRYTRNASGKRLYANISISVQGAIRSETSR